LKLVSADGKNVMFWEDNHYDYWKQEAFEMLQNLFMQNPDCFPLTMIMPHPEKEIVVVPVYFENADEKIKQLKVMSCLLKILKCKWYIIATECWVVVRQYEEGKEYDDVMPSKCDDRKECLMVIRVEDNGKNETAMFDIVRENDTVSFIENKNIEMGKGRLNELFDINIPDEMLEDIKKQLRL